MATIKINTGLTREQCSKMVSTIVENLDGYNPDATEETKQNLFNDFMVTQLGQWVANIVKAKKNNELSELMSKEIKKELETYGFKSMEKPIS